MIYRFKTNLLGKQVLQVSHGPKEYDSVTESNGVAESLPVILTIWHDADRYEAEKLLQDVRILE